MKRNQRKKQLQCRIFKTCLGVCLCTVIFSIGIILKKKYDEKVEEKIRIEQEDAQRKKEEEERKAELQRRLNVKIDFEEVYSKAVILKDLKNQKIIAAKESEEKIYPASMTKIMTALVAIENLKDLDEKLEIPFREVQELYNRGASMAGFWPGETVRVKDLLYGVMLPSGADCCLTLVKRVSASEYEFVNKMNEKAKELGMENTFFANATGLHDERHYTTVKDLMILLEYALENKEFYEVITTKSYTTESVQSNPNGLLLESTIYEKKDAVRITDGEFLGGKTGYTNMAGLCMASLAEVEGERYILVTASADGNHDTEPFHVIDAENIYSQIGEQIEE